MLATPPPFVQYNMWLGMRDENRFGREQVAWDESRFEREHASRLGREPLRTRASRLGREPLGMRSVWDESKSLGTRTALDENHFGREQVAWNESKSLGTRDESKLGTVSGNENRLASRLGHVAWDERPSRPPYVCMGGTSRPDGEHPVLGPRVRGDRWSWDHAYVCYLFSFTCMYFHKVNSLS